MGKLKTILLLALCWCLPAQAKVDQQDPYLMVEQVAATVLGHYKEQKTSIDEDPALLRTLVETDLMPYVNHTYASYKVMGKALKKASLEQRQRFTAEFRQYMITTFAQTFTVYKDQLIEYEPSKPVDNKKIVNVGVTFIDGGRPPIEVKFKMRRNKKTGEWQAIDLIAEGASILAAKEAEFAGLIRQQGLDAVIAMLAEKNREALTQEPAA